MKANTVKPHTYVKYSVIANCEYPSTWQAHSREDAKVSAVYNGMQRICRVLLILMFITCLYPIYSANVVSENIQNWTAATSYGNYNQTIPAGTVAMTRCLVSPNAQATGTASAGRIQCEANTARIEFPQFASIGQVEFTFAAGSTGRSIKLQRLIGETWTDVVTFTGINNTGAKFYHSLNINEPTTLRLSNPSHAVYVHDITITDFEDTIIPMVSTFEADNVTYDTALLRGIIESAGASPILAKGFCYATTPNPNLSNSSIEAGSGIAAFSATISGLDYEEEYYVRAYATNASGTAYGNQITFTTTQISTPTVQAGNFHFYPGNYSIQASWTPGNGARRLIKINTQNSFSIPADGIEYTVNPVYSGTGEQVVYHSGTEIIEGDPVNAVVVSNLIPNTVYWFRAYESNGTQSSVVYNSTIVANNPASTTTTNSLLEGYYDEISGYGQPLKTALHDLIRETHHTSFSYAALWQQLQYTDEDSLNTNNVIQIYTGWSLPKNYYGTGPDQWNREHTWSISHGGLGTTAPGGTDLHHIRPCDVTVNSAKGNKDFDEGGNPYTDATPYTGYTGYTGCNTSTNFWEPRDEDKGDVARMIMYMAVRYDGTDTAYDLEMEDTTPTAGPFYGKLSTLLRWHLHDPPDNRERRRNDRTQERQGNRNPFIDRPEYANQIWAPVAFPASDVTLNSFTASWTESVGALHYVIDVATDSLFTTGAMIIPNQDMELETSYSIYQLAPQEVYYYRLRAFLGENYSFDSNVVRVELLEWNPPIEISAFSVEQVPSLNLRINWTTESETDIMGYHLYRAEENDVELALRINEFLIPATNASTTTDYVYYDHRIADNATYYYWLEVLELDGSSTLFGPVAIYVILGSSTDETFVPAFYDIGNTFPNPFKSRVSFDVSVKNPERFSASVYNLKGQRVRTLRNSILNSGTHRIEWDAKNDNGTVEASGLYFVRIKIGDREYTRKAVLLK